MNLEDSSKRHAYEGRVPGTSQSASRLSQRWYLILTKPSSEELARVNLERQGYRVYFPRALQRKSYRGRWQDKVSALFPRYLFLQLNIASQVLAPVRSTFGVVDAVRFGADYAVVSDQVVDGLMRRADPQSGLHEIKRPLLTPGEIVRVVAGAFAGLEGVFEREIGEDRVVVLFKLLGRESPVDVVADYVVPIYA